MKQPGLFDLSGRVAVVTGGNRGIGRAIALGLARAGAAVAIFARNEEKNRQVLEEIRNVTVESLAVEVDVTCRDELESAFSLVEQRLGDIGILVNNAGVGSTAGGVLSGSPDDWERVVKTHLTSCFYTSRRAAESMTRSRNGKIINVGSMYSFFGYGMVPAYSAAKGAVIQLTRSMAIEFAPYNIQVNAIAPGWIETDMTAAVREISSMNAEVLARTPTARWGLPEDVAGTAVYLAARASDFVTGTTICVDGGYAIR